MMLFGASVENDIEVEDLLQGFRAIADADKTGIRLAVYDVNGKIDAGDLPAGYDDTPPAGTWAIDNTSPVLSDGSGTVGTKYKIVAAGTIDEGAGTLSIDGDAVAIGDTIVKGTTNWYIVPAAVNLLDGKGTEQTARDAISAFSDDEVNDRANARQPSNGADTRNAAAIISGGALANEIGTSDAGVEWDMAIHALDAGDQYIIQFDTTTVDGLRINSAGKIVVRLNSTDYVIDLALAAHEEIKTYWVTLDRDGDATLYVNGVAQSGAVDISAQSAYSVAGTAYRINETGASALDCTILNFRVWDSILTATKIAGISARGTVLAADQANVILSLQGRNLESDTWVDESGNELDGALTSCTLLYSRPQASGTFTPSLTFGGASVNMAYTTQYGVWEKLKEGVYNVYGLIVLSAKGDSTGNVQVEGLPFASFNNGAYVPPIEIHANNVSGMTGVIQARLNNNATTVSVRQSDATGNTPITHAVATDTTSIRFNFTYRVA